MQFSTLALSLLSVSSALAQVKVHVVQVGNANGSLAYYPNKLTADKGDMIQFQFAPNNHTVTQSTFDNPCMPIAMMSNVTGIYSGYMAVAATATTTPTYTVLVNATTPMWFYCSQGKHCQNGMVMVVNENTAANSTRSLETYKANAAKATVNLPGGSTSAGTDGTTTTPSNNAGGSTTTTNDTASSTTSAAGTKSTGSGAGMIKAPVVSSLVGAGVVAMVVGMFL